MLHSNLVFHPLLPAYGGRDLMSTQKGGGLARDKKPSTNLLSAAAAMWPQEHVGGGNALDMDSTAAFRRDVGHEFTS